MLEYSIVADKPGTIGDILLLAGFTGHSPFCAENGFENTNCLTSGPFSKCFRVNAFGNSGMPP